MPALPLVPDAARVVLPFENAESYPNRVNVLHFLRASGSNTPAQLIADLETNLSSDMWGLTAVSDVCSQIEVTPLYDTSNTIIHTMGTEIAGQGSGDYSPNLCALVKLNTDTRGPSFRGRVYLPDLSDAFHDAGVVKTANRDATTGHWVDFANAMAGAGRWSLAVVSYYHNNARRSTGVATQVTNVAVERMAATQRRRLKRT